MSAEALPDREEIAQLFHETYERLAPEFGYKTREATAVPWKDVPENNKALMIAVADALLARLRPALERQQERPGPKYLSSPPDFCPAAVDEAKHTACEHIRADLRACAEALEKHNDAIWLFISQQHYGFNRHEDVVSTGGWQACQKEPCVTFEALYDKFSTSLGAEAARAALARPGVRAEMKK